jgi:hypothetical protein
MLLDKYLPKWDFTEVHTIKVKATPDAAYRALLEVTMPELSGIVSLLFYLRTLPEKMAGRRGNWLNSESNKPMMGQMLENGFVKIEEQAPQEIVFGMIVPGAIGRVWKKSSNLDVTPEDAPQLLAFKDPEYLWVIANFMVKATDKPGTVILYTESRTKGLSPKATKSFSPYWAFIRPWSGLIRRLWLRAIKRRAER